MDYIRVVVNNVDSEEKIEKLGFSFKCQYAFTDYFYKESFDNSSTLSLKMRVYSQNDWHCKNIVVIKKKTVTTTENVKLETILDKQEFDDVNAAKSYLEKSYPNLIYLFKMSRTGKQYSDGRVNVWVENLEYLGYSVEIGMTQKADADLVLSCLDIKSIVETPLAEMVYDIVKRL